ncbi:hypothetical protein ANN_16318 [Periplaneta americana]|uniref:Uncharacterized protein n=1 Tax=Periplaneta americana TaxID=6978 RepID=A0ABQ8SJF5_PERAM|nr:hypothetical protein ANN_16318 [Periplaneta americana]
MDGRQWWSAPRRLTARRAETAAEASLLADTLRPSGLSANDDSGYNCSANDSKKMLNKLATKFRQSLMSLGRVFHKRESEIVYDDEYDDVLCVDRPVYVIDVYKLTPSNGPKERSRRVRDLTVASDNLSAIEFRPGDFFFNVEPVIRNEATHRKIVFRVGILA